MGKTAIYKPEMLYRKNRTGKTITVGGVE